MSMRSEGYCSCVCVCVCVSVCLSVKSHLTYGVFVHPEIAVTYSVGNNGKNIVAISLKLLHCKGPTLPLLYSYGYSGHLSTESMHAHNLPRGGPKAASHFYLCGDAEKTVASFVSCHWSCLQKICPQRNAVVPKVCKSYQHVFRVTTRAYLASQSYEVIVSVFIR